jgi:hypothetical protein
LTGWSSGELDKIGGADELQLASLRGDGKLRKPVTIWVVRHGADLYVRSWRGHDSAWFRGVQDRHEGHISSGGIEKDVRFDEVDDVDDQLDAAYRTKYERYSEYVEPMIAPQARATTLRLVPKPA